MGDDRYEVRIGQLVGHCPHCGGPVTIGEPEVLVTDTVLRARVAELEAEAAKWERATRFLSRVVLRQSARSAPQAQEDQCGSEQDDEDTYRDRLRARVAELEDERNFAMAEADKWKRKAKMLEADLEVAESRKSGVIRDLTDRNRKLQAALERLATPEWIAHAVGGEP